MLSKLSRSLGACPKECHIRDRTVKDTIYSIHGESIIIRFTDGTYCVLEADHSFDGVEIFSTSEVNYDLFSKQVLSECEFMLDAELDTIYDGLAHQQKLDAISLIKEQILDYKITLEEVAGHIRIDGGSDVKHVDVCLFNKNADNIS